MKGGIAVAAHAARVLARGARPFARLELVSCPDEESRPAPETHERLDGFDAVLCLECGRPDGEVVAARKGARGSASHAAASAHAGVEPDTAATPCWRSVASPCGAALDHARDGLTLHLTRMRAATG